MFGNLGQVMDLMRNAGKIRERVEEINDDLKATRIEGTAAEGRVTAVVNGLLEVQSIRIDPSLAGPSARELLEGSVMAAVNQALGKAREEAARSMSTLTGGMSIPGLPGGL